MLCYVVISYCDMSCIVGVIANAKHWIENNQETDRDTVSANVDERTRHELYYQPFQVDWLID